MVDSPGRPASSKIRRTRGELDFISCLMLRDSHPLILQGGLTITQTQRPVEIDAPDGNRTHVSRTHPGVLSQLNYGNIRESTQTCSADHGRGFVAVSAKADGQV